MAIFINSDSKVIVQGMTGSEGTKHTKRMLKAGTKVVGGVTPGKGGQSVDMDGTTLPVFNSVAEAMAATGANVSVVFVPPKFAKGAVIDAIDVKMPLVVVITEGIPVHDSAYFYTYASSIALRPHPVSKLNHFLHFPSNMAKYPPLNCSTRPSVRFLASFQLP